MKNVFKPVSRACLGWKSPLPLDIAFTHWLHTAHTASSIKLLSPPPGSGCWLWFIGISRKCGFHQGFRVLNIESLVRGFLRVSFYIKHFNVAAFRLLQQLSDQVMSVAKELLECRRTSTSIVKASQQGHGTRTRAQPAKPHSSQSAKVDRPKEILLRSHNQSKKRLMTWQGGGLPLSRTSFAAPLSSSRGPAVPIHGLLEVRFRRPICASTSPTGSLAQLCVSATIDHQSDAFCASRAQQQGWASSKRDSLHVG